jgi:hypothetical protein
VARRRRFNRNLTISLSRELRNLLFVMTAAPRGTPAVPGALLTSLWNRAWVGAHRFAAGRQHDAQEFFGFLVNALHAEMVAEGSRNLRGRRGAVRAALFIFCF